MFAKRGALATLGALTVFALLGTVTAAPTVTLDTFPAALANYAVDGWTAQGYGVDGTLTTTADAVDLHGLDNSLVFALRNSPQVTNFALELNFTLVGRDYTEADAFVFMLRWNQGTFPTCCAIPSAASGIYLSFNIGRNQLQVFESSNYAYTFLGFTGTSVSLGQPHHVIIGFTANTLLVFLDGTRVLGFHTPSLPAGQVGFEVYRVDMTVASLALVAM